jgi:hypothetical protein
MKTIFFFFFCFLRVFSQDNNHLDVKLSMRSFEGYIDVGKAGLWVPGKSVDNFVGGSLYLFPNWIGPYSVYLKNGKSTQLLNLNYNLNTKNLEALISKDSVFQYDLAQIDYVVNSNKRYKIIQNSQLNGMFQEVFNGEKLKIFKEASLAVRKGGFDRLTQTKLEVDKYEQVFSYHIFAEDKYEKDKICRKLILKHTSDKADLIKKFVLQNKLNYKSDEDVNRILNYYVSL